MPKPPQPLTALTSAQRAQAQERFEIIRPALEEGVTQAQVARTHQISASTVQSWIKRYREKRFAGLANEGRSDKGKSRHLPPEAITLIEGLAEHSPPRSMAVIHRQMIEIADDYTEKEAVATILRVTRGNIRVIERLMMGGTSMY